MERERASGADETGGRRAASALAADADVAAQAVDALASFLARAGTVLALTGAGVSTDSGIPDYRDALGEWKRPEPVRIAEFLATEGHADVIGRAAWSGGRSSAERAPAARIAPSPTSRRSVASATS